VTLTSEALFLLFALLTFLTSVSIFLLFAALSVLAPASLVLLFGTLTLLALVLLFLFDPETEDLDLFCFELGSAALPAAGLLLTGTDFAGEAVLDLLAAGVAAFVAEVLFTVLAAASTAACVSVFLGVFEVLLRDGVLAVDFVGVFAGDFLDFVAAEDDFLLTWDDFIGVADSEDETELFLREDFRREVRGFEGGIGVPGEMTIVPSDLR